MGLEGSGAFRRQGSIVRVLRTERWVRPTERAGSEGSLICRLRRQENPTTALAGGGNAVPLWWLAPPPFPRKRGHYKAPLCCELLMKGLLFRALFFPRLRGKSGAAGKGASAASQSAECVSSYMTHNDNPVTLTSCSSPVRAIPQPSGPKAPSNLRTLGLKAHPS